VSGARNRARADHQHGSSSAHHATGRGRSRIRRRPSTRSRLTINGARRTAPTTSRAGRSTNRNAATGMAPGLAAGTCRQHGSIEPTVDEEHGPRSVRARPGTGVPAAGRQRADDDVMATKMRRTWVGGSVYLGVDRTDRCCFPIRPSRSSTRGSPASSSWHRGVERLWTRRAAGIEGSGCGFGLLPYTSCLRHPYNRHAVGLATGRSSLSQPSDNANGGTHRPHRPSGTCEHLTRRVTPPTTTHDHVLRIRRENAPERPNDVIVSWTERCGSSNPGWSITGTTRRQGGTRNRRYVFGASTRPRFGRTRRRRHGAAQRVVLLAGRTPPVRVGDIDRSGVRHGRSRPVNAGLLGHGTGRLGRYPLRP